VVLCVAPTTLQRPTTNPFEGDPASVGRFVDEDAGDPVGVEEWRVYADSVDDLPNRPDATPVAAASIYALLVGVLGRCVKYKRTRLIV
jgi:hypothetical protein